MNSKVPKIFQCGTNVNIKISGIKAMITEARIGFDSINYELTYFYDGEHRTICLNENEFTTNESKKIGYKHK